MTSYISYFGYYILSTIERTIKTLIIHDTLLPISSVSDNEKCKDMNLDSVSFIGRPKSTREFVASIIGDDNYV
jgi:hypothetical protein